eukprot:2424506-Heterocapsa_arctica.AAC.1
MVHFEDGLIITGGQAIGFAQIYRIPAGGADSKHTWILPRRLKPPTLTNCEDIYTFELSGS